ncbi:MAG: DUF1549 domain-containing protein [Pirellulales bacterium]
MNIPSNVSHRLGCVPRSATARLPALFTAWITASLTAGIVAAFGTIAFGTIAFRTMATSAAEPTKSVKPQSERAQPSVARPDVGQTAREADRLLAEETTAGTPQDGRRTPRVDDETFLRRVSLDLIGRAPTPEQTTAFALDSDPQKRARIVDKLLADPRYGENWGRYWRDVIFYRRTEERALFGAELCADYLAQQLNDNKPWDDVATAFVTATGDVSEEGATGLIFAHRGEPEAVVSEVTRIFNGIQISCAQCHDHPTDHWKRDEFHKMAAFFPRIALRPNPGEMGRGFTVTATDFEPRFRARNAMQRIQGTLEHYMPDLNDPQAKGTLMQPVFYVSGQAIELGVKDADRRAQFAKYLTSPDNPWFARALVNRLWSELVGEGFYEPIDDLGPERECSAPKTLDCLAQSFTASGYDMKELFRTITATAAYQRESRSRRDPDDVPFAANTAQRLRGDQLYNQLAQLLGVVDAAPAGRGGPMALRRGPRGQFNAVFGFDPSNPRDEVVGSIPQALVLMNSPLINGNISAQRGMLGKLVAQIKNDDDLTVELYLRALGREPTAVELAACREHVKEVGVRGEAFEDVLWSLINSTEFLHRK